MNLPAGNGSMDWGDCLLPGFRTLAQRTCVGHGQDEQDERGGDCSEDSSRLPPAVRCPSNRHLRGVGKGRRPPGGAALLPSAPRLEGCRG